MQMLPLLAAALSMANAFSVNMDNIDKKLRLLNPVLMIGEELIQLKDQNQCYEKAFCIMETIVDDGVMNPLTHFSRFLTNSHFDVEPVAFDQIKSQLQKFPKYTQIVNSIVFAKPFNNTEACSQQFHSCSVSKEDLISAFKAFDDEHIFHTLTKGNERRRDGCSASGAACGAVGIGCAFCTVLTEGLCGLACEPTALQCGVNGLSCAFG